MKESKQATVIQSQLTSPTPSSVQAPQFSAIYIKRGSKSHVYEACLLDVYSICSAQPCYFTSPFLNVGVRQK